MVQFDHRDPGTPEELWRDEPRLAGSAPLALEVDQLIVIAAHPDDETLGAAGLIRRVRSEGGAVRVIVVTDGEASHPGSPSHSPAQLAARRRDEALRALAGLVEEVEVEFLGVPDGCLSDHRARLARSLEKTLDARGAAESRLDRVIVAAPWSGDGHRDHRIAAEVVAEVCAGRGIRHVGYPIWAWHWGTPDDVPWGAARALTLTRDEVRAKRRALSVHTSQIAPLSRAPGDEVILHPEMLAHFSRNVEIFIEESAPRAETSMSAAAFEDFYRRHDDPWGFETRWYEERKRSILLSSLPQKEIGDVLEIGCSTGLVTRELATRAERVTAIDPVAAALDAVRARVADGTPLRLVQGQVPRDWPDGTFDTIVLSEVGYYLSADDLAATIGLIAESLAEDGVLVACHWRPPVRGYPATGDEVHAALRSQPQWQRIVGHEEPDFLLDVFAAGPALSVAQREGLQ